MRTLTKEQLKRAEGAFNFLDSNKDETLLVEEFREALKPLLTDEELDAWLKEVNPNGDNVITYQEFLEDYSKDLDA